MRLEDYRSDFYVYVVNADNQADIFSERGYTIEKFQTENELLAAVKKAPPHFIVGGLLGLDFLEEVKTLSPEIKVIPTSEGNTWGAVQEADVTARLFLLQLEQEQVQAEVTKTIFQPPQIAEDTYFDKAKLFVDLVGKIKSADDVMEKLVQSASSLSGSRPVIYLKYLPAHTALVLKKAAGLNADEIRSVGVPLHFMQPLEAQKMLCESPDKIDILREMLKEVFGLLEFTIHPVNVRSGMTLNSLGTLVFFRPLRTEENKKLFNFYLQIATERIQTLELENTLQGMNSLDVVTSLPNERTFDKKLDEEVSRARRLNLPVSLIVFEIDHFLKYRDNNGEAMANVIAKSIAQMMVRNSRNTDVVARLSEEKFAIICSHSSLATIAAKAEKLREAISSTPFPCGEKQPLGKLTASFGVSEFPSVSSSSVTLGKSAEEALHRIKQGGRNRVCVADAPRGFKPEFEFGADDRT